MADPKKDAASKDGKDEVSEEKKRRLKEEKRVRRHERNFRNVEQYILSQNINEVSSYYREHLGLFAYRTFRQVNGSSPDIVTRLRGLPDLSPFLGLKNSTLSLLQPKIKIYRVTYEELAPEAATETVIDAEGPTEGSSPDGFTEVQTMATGQRIPLNTPCYREFKFSDNFGRENAASVEDYLASESTKASWRNIGLESFRVRQIGTSHGAVEHNIECSLQIKLKSLKDLTAQPPGEPPPEKGGLRYVDLVIHPGARIDRETEHINPMHYEIKVLLGYHSPTKDMIQNIGSEPSNSKQVKLLESLEKMNIVLALSLRDYDFNIDDDGSVTLSINYWGRIESVLNNSYANIFQETFVVGKEGNLLYSPKAEIKNNYGALAKLSSQILSAHRGMNSPACKIPDCEAKKLIQKLLKESELFVSIIKAENVPGASDKTPDLAKIFEWFKEADNVNLLISALKKKGAAFREQVYEGFMAQLIDGNPQTAGGNGTRLFCASANKEKVQQAMGLINSAGDEATKKSKIKREEAKRESTTAIGEASKTLAVGRCSEIKMSSDKSLANLKQSTANSIKAAVEEESKSKDGKKADEPPERDPAKVSVLSPSEGPHKYYFLFLGDIIELACKNAGLKALKLPSQTLALAEGRDTKNPTMPNQGSHIYVQESYIEGEESALDYPLNGVRLLLGPLEYYDSSSTLQRINLAQFPISFDLFQAWFLQTIVRKAKIKMPIGTFITKIINQLVMPALSTDFIRALKPRGTRTESISLSLPGRQMKGAKITICGRPTSPVTELLPLEPEIDIYSDEFTVNYYDKARQVTSDESMIRTSFDYWLVQVSTIRDITKRTGRPQEDIKDGLFHFNIGSDRGLLKSMKFKKSALKGLGVMRSFHAIEGGGDQLAQLREVYDCDVTLIGNSLFTPGMLFYANASLLGLGDVADAKSLAYQLNLGGYFAIMETEMEISSGHYETRLTGKQQGFGKKRGK